MNYIINGGLWQFRIGYIIVDNVSSLAMQKFLWMIICSDAHVLDVSIHCLVEEIECACFFSKATDKLAVVCSVF